MYSNLRWVAITLIPGVAGHPLRFMLYGDRLVNGEKVATNLGRVEQYASGWFVGFTCTTTKTGSWEWIRDPTSFPSLEDAQAYLIANFPIVMAESALAKAGQ